MAAFPQRTSQDCYASFPIEVKASCPLGMGAAEGWLAASEGPCSGARVPPTVVEHREGAGEATEADVARNQRFLAARRGVEHL